MNKVYSRVWQPRSEKFWSPYAWTETRSINRVPEIGSDVAPPEFLFEWQLGSDLVGDCVSPWGDTEIIIRKALAQEIVTQFSEIKLIPARALGVPRKKGARKRVVDSPIEFAGLWPTRWASFDERLRWC
jgi:hypothetical protein